MTELSLAGIQQVELQDVEKTLRAMWGSTASAEDAEKAAPVIRACALNLVVYVADKSSLPRMLEAIDQVSLSSPNRAIVLVIDSEKMGADLATYIKSVCRLPDASGRKLCCEQIVVVGGPEASNVIHSVIDPLLVPDLPVYVWWNYRPEFEGPLFERFTRVADRLIVDSDLFDRNDFDRLVDFVSRGSKDLVVSDLNWGRLTRWRQLLSQIYDSVHYRTHLNRLQRVQMECFLRSPFPVRVLLLTGWLASRLSWIPEGRITQRENGVDARFRTPAEDISVSFTMIAGNGEDSAISSIRLDTADGATFLVKRSAGGDFAETSVQLPGAVSNVSVGKMPNIALEEILSRELELLDRDWAYEEALQMASRLV